MIAALLSLWDLTVRHVQQLEEHADNWGLIKPNHILIYCCYTKEYNVQSLPTVPAPPHHDIAMRAELLMSGAG